MKILAVDQARAGAWSIFNVDNQALEGYGEFSFRDKRMTYSQAILHIEELIESVINGYEVDAVYLEDIQLRANPQSFKKLAQLQGVLINLCEKRGIPYDVIAPTQWQNFCKARGRRQKEVDAGITEVDGKKKSKVLSMQFVKDTFQIETDNDNLADAICIGWYVVNKYYNQELKEDETNG